MRKQIGLIGIGNAGNQIVNLAMKKYPNLFDSVYINTSESDLAMIQADDTIKFKIGNKEEVEGSGKNRTKMKQYLKGYIKTMLKNQSFIDMVADKKYVFILASTAGGTGSGAAPVLFEILRMGFNITNFILVGILPQMKASLMEQSNSLEFINELYGALGDKTTYMIYDNERTADASPTEGLDIVNENIVEDIKIFTGVDNYSTKYESIDQADMESIITTPGRLIVTRINRGLTEKVLEDASIDDILIKAIKQSCHTETDRNKKVVRWGVTTYFTDPVNKLYNNTFEKLIDFIGTPVERFNHNAIHSNKEDLNFLHFIGSGLSPINDRVKKITDRIDELKNALASDETNRYLLSEEEASERILLRQEADKKSVEFNVESIFSKFD